MGLRALCVLGAAAVALGAVEGALAVTGPNQSSILAAVSAQRSYHYVAVQTVATTQIRIVGDATSDRGIQQITYRRGSRTGHVTVVVVANTAYIRGDAFTLTNYIGFPAAAAAQQADKWLKVAHTAAGFAQVAADVRLDKSALHQFKMPPPVRTNGTATIGGQRVIRLQAKLSHAGRTGTQTLYVRAAGAPLPVEQMVVSKGTVIFDVRYGKWNEAVHVAVPSNFVTA